VRSYGIFEGLRLERACLRTGAGGSIVPAVRALFADADISARLLSGDGMRVGWGNCDTNYSCVSMVDGISDT
jgi:hypothetical protein